MNTNEQCSDLAASAMSQCKQIAYYREMNYAAREQECFGYVRHYADRIIALRTNEARELAAHTDTKEDDYAHELAYIRLTAATKSWANFSGDPECFVRYVNMQANFAERRGFWTIAQDMRSVVAGGAL